MLVESLKQLHAECMSFMLECGRSATAVSLRACAVFWSACLRRGTTTLVSGRPSTHCCVKTWQSLVTTSCVGLQVYDKAVRTVPEDARLPIYDRYLKRASTFFGIAKVRSVARKCCFCIAA